MSIVLRSRSRVIIKATLFTLSLSLFLSVYINSPLRTRHREIIDVDFQVSRGTLDPFHANVGNRQKFERTSTSIVGNLIRTIDRNGVKVRKSFNGKAGLSSIVFRINLETIIKDPIIIIRWC